MLKFITLTFFTWKTLVIFLAFVAVYLLPLHTEFIPKDPYRDGLPYFIWIWGNFDGYHYMTIAQNGYGFLQHPFFPLYPLLIRIVLYVLRLTPLLAGLVVSHVAFIGSLVVIYRLLMIDRIKPGISWFMPLILFPTSFYYGAVYNDSLYLLFASLTLFFGRKHKWILASIMGGLASLTRLNGLALISFLCIEYITQSDSRITTWRFNKFKQKILMYILEFKKHIVSVWFIVIPISFFSYLMYVQLVYGSWYLVFSAMRVWNQDRITFPLQVFFRYFKIIALYPHFDIVYFVAFFEISLVIFYCYMLLFGYKKIRLSYWVYILISFLIPSLTGTFAGMPRYALHLYPFFLTIGMWLTTKHLAVRILYYGISIALFLFSIALFTRGYFVS
ncbi:MAG: hypothetical protein UU81_C0003G0018 [Microgenomates group bacterium GW2011_GWC1_41_8]|uniref:Glycosyltransferase RgtA/B/C/D-like domain-containing protein n=3 Tax=Candidatus Roizmaniibacteriota TaxID=1752723 RepID=A0A0G0XC78_9BACT|nr:MAG: hypothetical protein UU14_C0015G0015 [Candidatus Roizmanbacteria bacterium GW2011_GWB1_40_7]KKR94719.1 MAG: hypothetical protein UU41_C0004G0019 [Candidatus Roizmanbacteria bacterium GW2011_GWA1_41_13]KKS21992.1 MAG: hypothetical protein UU78_C0025G0002 [Candidatus Roizmanbacteria bacterium GW2011_GWC2_41_7]KKS24702.1 MAG: hypothetical protein UU81_C0003G0018 [Microgenomates group bacterium GW2011_GWC1_41_8]OGK50032.1 MAG: hypothetical protein A3A55_03665 [Candidatus Roizmanbacteria bac